MTGKISDLTPATAYNSTDEVELLQSGGNLRLTKGVLRKLLYGTAADGNTPRYDSSLANVDTVSGGTGDWVLDDASGYRLVNTGRYSTTPSSTSVFTVTNTDDFETKDSTGAASGTIDIGLPVRFVIASTAYYGIVTAGTQNTSITISGASITGTFSSLAVGPHEKVIQLPINILQTSYTTSNNTDLLSTVTGRQYLTWSGPKARLVRFGFTHASATSPVLNVKINGSIVGTSNVTVSATAGTWTYNSAVALDTSLYDINYGEAIEIRCVTHAASSNYLNSLLVFVLE